MSSSHQQCRVDDPEPPAHGAAVGPLAPKPPESSEVGTVSLQARVPEELVQAMRRFLERHPNWDQYRLVQAALAGFLVQNGVQNRDLTRCYLANLFPAQSDFRPF